MSMKSARRRGPAERRRRARAARAACRAQAREHHEAVDREQPLPAREQRRRVGRPHAASCWPRPAAACRGGASVSATTVGAPRPAPAEPTTTAAQRAARAARAPARVGFDHDAPRLRDRPLPAPRRWRRARPTSRAIRRRLQPDRRQPLGHAPGDFAVQPGRRRAARQSAQRRRGRASGRKAERPAAVGGSAMGTGQYIEPMRATPSIDTPARRQRSGLPSLCAVCHGWGRRRICDACIAPLRARRASAAGAARSRSPRRRDGLRRLPGRPAAVRRGRWPRVDYGFPWDRADRRASSSTTALDLAAALAGLLVDARRDARGRRPPTCSLPVPLEPRSGCASAATTRPGSWPAGSRGGCALPGRCRRCCCACATRRTSSRCRPTSAPPTCAAPSRSSRAGARELQGRDVTLVDDVMTTGATAAEISARAAARPARRAVRGLGAGAHAARRRGTERRGSPTRDVQHRPGPAGDPAEHRQRDPAGRQHRLRAAPGRAARLLDGRPAAAARRPRLPRVRRGATPCVVGRAARRRAPAAGGRAVRLHARARGRRFAEVAWQPGDWLVFGSETAGLPAAVRDALRRRRSGCACRCGPASAA